MDIVVNEELQAYIDPLTPDEYRSLEQSILAEGCREALILWGDVLVDGHNRYAICSKHGLPFRTIQSSRFQSMEDVHLWMIDQHLGRRSLSDFQRGVLALRKREIVAERLARSQAPAESQAAQAPAGETDAAPPPVADAQDTTREALARAARLSGNQVLQIEKITRQAAPEVVAAVKAGEISIHAAATVASLPLQEQVAAASGGKEELKQAAKRVREARRKPAAEAPRPSQDAEEAQESVETIASLRERVAVLTAENAQLREALARLQGQVAGD